MASLGDIQGLFKKRLATYKSDSETFIASVAATEGIISSPLAEDQIQTTFKRDGKIVTETVEIGKRIAQFKKLVQKEDAKLTDYWKQWEEVRAEFADIGAEVFGRDAFGLTEVENQGNVKGFSRDMKTLNLEHNPTIEDFKAEVKEIGEKALQKMKASEKVRRSRSIP